MTQVGHNSDKTAKELWKENNKDELREYNRRYARNHREALRRNFTRYHRNLKRDVIGHYSPEMKCMNPDCLVLGGCRDIRCLSIDHINDDGAEHRRQLYGTNASGLRFYNWLKRNGYPDGFQVLCMNCQWIKKEEARGPLNGEID